MLLLPVEVLGNDIAMAFSAGYGEIGGQARPSVNLQTIKEKTYGDGTPDFTAPERKRYLLWGCHSDIVNDRTHLQPRRALQLQICGQTAGTFGCELQGT